MSQTSSGFGAFSDPNAAGNPFVSASIPQTNSIQPSENFGETQFPPESPNTGVSQTQASGFDVNAMMGSTNTVPVQSNADAQQSPFWNVNQPSGQATSPNTSGSPFDVTGGGSPFNATSTVSPFANAENGGQAAPMFNNAPSTSPFANQPSGTNNQPTQVGDPMQNFGGFPPQNSSAPQNTGFPQGTGFPPPSNYQTPTNPQHNGGQGRQGNNQQKFNIAEFYWLINRKLYHNMQLNPGEAQMLIIGFNADFNNLRLSLCDFNGVNPTQLTAITVGTFSRSVTINIYSEFAMELLQNIKTPTGQPITNIERVFSQNNNWSPNASSFICQAEGVIITTNDANNSHSFTLFQHHVPALVSALTYMTDGRAWTDHLMIRSR